MKVPGPAPATVTGTSMAWQWGAWSARALATPSARARNGTMSLAFIGMPPFVIQVIAPGGGRQSVAGTGNPISAGFSHVLGSTHASRLPPREGRAGERPARGHRRAAPPAHGGAGHVRQGRLALRERARQRPL